MYVEIVAAGLANNTAEEIHQAFSVKNIPIVNGISCNTFAIWAGSTGLRAVIADHAVNAQSPLRAIALTLLDLLQGNLEPNLDLGLATNLQMLGAWVQAGAITQAQHDSLIALATKNISKFDQLGVYPSVQDIANIMNEDH